MGRKSWRWDDLGKDTNGDASLYKRIRRACVNHNITYAEYKQSPEKYPSDDNIHREFSKVRKEDRAKYEQLRKLKVLLGSKYQEDAITKYNQMLTNQDHKCAICGATESKSHRSGRVHALSIDHNHETNEIRGLLCNNCNRAIGLLKDDPTILQKAINYLTKK